MKGKILTVLITISLLLVTQAEAARICMNVPAHWEEGAPIVAMDIPSRTTGQSS